MKKHGKPKNETTSVEVTLLQKIGISLLGLFSIYGATIALMAFLILTGNFITWGWNGVTDRIFDDMQSWGLFRVSLIPGAVIAIILWARVNYEVRPRI